MNPRIKRLLSMLLALTMVFSLFAPVTASAASTTASNNVVEIEVGESKKLSSSGWFSKTTWTTSDETVATVSSNGTVTGVAVGTATITATSKGFFGFGAAKTTTYTVVVTEGTAQEPTEPEVTEPQVTEPEATEPEAEGLTVKVGETLQLTVSEEGTVTWKSSDKGVATVDGNGLVTGVSEGVVTITATVKKTTGNKWFFWWGNKTTTTTVQFQVTVLPADQDPTEPEPTEPEVTEPEPTEPEVTEPEVVTYTVTFESNGGSEVEAQVVEAGMTVAEPEAPTKTSYIFLGWYTDSELTNLYDFETPVTDDMTLYAAWEDDGICIVTFDTNGGSAVVEQAVYDGEYAFRPENPTKEGYVFENWYADPELTTLFDFSQPINADTTVYANWTELNVIITLDAGDYADNIVNRTVTGSVAYNIAIESITYELASANSTTTGEIDLTEAEGFSIDVLLEDGDNVLTVFVATVDGSVVSESVTMTFDSGYVYDSGEVYDEFDERLIKTPIETDEEGNPTVYLVANILSLYFYDSVTYEEREAFITETLGGEVAGYLNSLDMMQILLPNPVPKAEEIGYIGETDLTLISEDEIWEYADALAAAYGDILESVDPEHIYMDSTLTITTDDPWGNNANNDWWLEAIDAYDAWEYDDYYNLDYLTDFTLGVMDNGFRTSHEDLSGNVRVISKKDTVDDHGTHVSGIIVAEANNGTGIAGVTYNNGYLYAYDVDGNFSDSTINEAMTKLVEKGAKVINFSMGRAHIDVPANSSEMSASKIKNYGKTYSKYMGKLLAKGNDFIIVESAGNGNKANIGVDYWNNGFFCSINSSNCYSSNGGLFSNAISKQEIMDRIVIVAAVDSSNALTSFSNGNSGGSLNIIAAPGATIYSASSTGNSAYVNKSGTSMSAPIVTGVCGLVWSVNTELSGAQVVDLVMNNNRGTATTNTASFTTGGMGVINALESVEAAIDTLPTHYGYVVDATTGAALTSATITIYNDNGEVVGEAGIYYTDSNGRFTLPKLPYGSYTLVIEAEDYVTTSFSFGAMCPLDGSNTINLGTIGLSPVMNEEEYRIILRWTGNPSDLDSHLVATTADGASYHVFYANRNPSPAYANLDRDDTDYEGPETITITNFSSLRNIRYAVHDYSNRSSSTSTVMSNSGAYVEVYKGSTLIKTFNVPVNTGGTEWDVFAIDANGNIIPTNQMTFCSDPDNVLISGISTNAATVMSAYEKK